jgi:hypothetical protein
MNLVGNKVKLFLINSLSAEGEVESWTDDKVVLIFNGRKLIINNPQQNIIMYYVFDKMSADPAPKKEFFWDVKEPELDEPVKDQNLKIKKLAELKIMSAEAQREQIRKELTTFKPINTDQILGKYGTPSFIISQHNSSEETVTRNADDARGLSKMPGKGSE